MRTLNVDMITTLVTSVSTPNLELSFFFGPGLLLAVFLVHYAYFRKALLSNGQQVIELSDFTKTDGTPIGQSIIEADGLEFCAIQGSVSSCDLIPARPNIAVIAGRPFAKKRYSGPLEIGQYDVLHTVVCAEDLTATHAAHFFAPVKVGGDLTVTGEVYFDQIVVVNGALKVEGHACFARGVIVKGDALVTGDITIGTRNGKGWAVFGSLSLSSRLKLNGRVISDQDLELPKAA